MSKSKNTDYACYLCKKVKFFKTFDNLLKHNCRFHNCEKETIKETKDEKILRLIPNVEKMYFVCVNALKNINKQVINKEYKLKTYIKIELNEPVFIYLDEPIFIEKIVTETIEEFEEEIKEEKNDDDDDEYYFEDKYDPNFVEENYYDEYNERTEEDENNDDNTDYEEYYKSLVRQSQ